ncbi:MAG: aspartyl-phosphate phosphatase Spo0E family protein [Bacillota bacterium]|nr:aspartyl-phosphate phosphatase Spo0E family protein [Bacillota bacterium]
MSHHKAIINKIEELRRELTDLAYTHELTSAEVIDASQRLDKVLNYYREWYQEKKIYYGETKSG